MLSKITETEKDITVAISKTVTTTQFSVVKESLTATEEKTATLDERRHTVNNAEHFEEFLHCLRTQKIKKIHLAEVCLIVTPAAGDFCSVVLEFEDCMYFVTSKYLVKDNVEIDEIGALKIECLDDIKHEITEDEIYKTLDYENKEISFVMELINEDGYFDGFELKTKDYFLFITVDLPALVFHGSKMESTKALLYSHQFGDLDCDFENDYVEIFPEG